MKKSKIGFKVFPKTIYSDIVSMPDPMLIGVTIHYYNFHTSALYMKIFVEGVGWSSNSVALGSLGAGLEAYKNLDNFSSIARPSAEVTKTLHLTLKGYTDAAYTDEFASFSRDVTVIFIKSDDGSWIEDVLNNFDDGTVQGWAIENVSGAGGLQLIVSADYVLSAPFSLRFRFNGPAAALCAYQEGEARIYKQFTTPNRSQVYAIIDIRLRPYSDAFTESYAKHLRVLRDDTVLVYFGKPYVAGVLNDVAVNKWIRIAVPLPPNTTFTLRISLDMSNHCSAACPGGQYIYGNMDDFKIISK